MKQRRMPYIRINEGNIDYFCPVCRTLLPRNVYIASLHCPICGSYLNRTSKGMIKVYELFDKLLYNQFRIR